MLVSADQILCHLIGDYVIQSDWMANEKTKKLWPAFLHAVSYSVPFLLVVDWEKHPSAIFWIVFTHAAIDRWRLARYLCWAKNFWPKTGRFPWSECTATGYHKDRPAWLAVWLMIVADNTLHILINALAIRFA